MLLEALKAIASAFKDSKIPYMVIGGQAALQYGVARFTQDIGITVGLSPEHLNRVLDAVRKSFRPLPQKIDAFVKDTWVLPIEHKSTKIRVDIVFSITHFERNAIKNAKKIRIDRTVVKYISPEDLIVQKIVAGRERDLDDVRAILKVQGKRVNRLKIKRAIKVFAQAEGKKELYRRWQAITKS